MLSLSDFEYNNENLKGKLGKSINKAKKGEVIKYGIIKDKVLFEYLENDKNRDKESEKL